LITYYRAFHKFSQAKFGYGGLILGSSQLTQLPQLSLTLFGVYVSKNNTRLKSVQNQAKKII